MAGPSRLHASSLASALLCLVAGISMLVATAPRAGAQDNGSRTSPDRTRTSRVDESSLPAWARRLDEKMRERRAAIGGDSSGRRATSDTERARDTGRVLQPATYDRLGRRTVEASTTPAIEVRLAETAPIRGADVRLADIATVTAVDPDVRRVLLETRITSRPTFGYNRVLARIEIQQQLALAGFSAADYSMTGSRGVVLQSLAHTLRPQQLLDAAQPALESYLREYAPQDEYLVESAGTVRAARVPPGRIHFELAPRVDTRRPIQDRASVLVDVVVDGDVHETIRVDFRVRRFIQALHVTRPVDIGEPLGPHNLELRRMPSTSTFANEVRSLEEIGGKVAARRLTTNHVLRPTDLSAPAIIRPQDRVRVVSRRGGIQVVVYAQAVDRAAQGEPCRVVTLEGRKVLQAVALAPGIVVVGGR